MNKQSGVAMMIPYWSNYRAAWMAALNTVINTQKLLLAQAKWMLSQARPLPRRPGGGEHDEQATASAAIAARAGGEKRLEQAPHKPGGSGSRRRKRKSLRRPR